MLQDSLFGANSDRSDVSICSERALDFSPAAVSAIAGS